MSELHELDADELGTDFTKYVRRIDFRDRLRFGSNPGDVGEHPVHITTEILFDLEPPDEHAMCFGQVHGHWAILPVQDVADDSGQFPTTVVMLPVRAAAIHLTPIPSPDDRPRGLVHLGRHQFFTPPDPVDEAALAAADPDDVLPVRVYAAEVHFTKVVDGEDPA